VRFLVISIRWLFLSLKTKGWRFTIWDSCNCHELLSCFLDCDVVFCSRHDQLCFKVHVNFCLHFRRYYQGIYCCKAFGRINKCIENSAYPKKKKVKGFHISSRAWLSLTHCVLCTTCGCNVWCFGARLHISKSYMHSAMGGGAMRQKQTRSIQ
jgi:hypothetical protein